MKLYLGSVESFLPHQTRIYTDVDGKLVDLNPAYAAYLTQVQGKHSSAYDLGAYYFPQTITAFLQRGGQGQEALNETVAFVRAGGLDDLRGPAGEKLAYDPKEVRLLPPLQNAEKSFVIGFSDRARIEAMPKAEILMGFYKLP